MTRTAGWMAGGVAVLAVFVVIGLLAGTIASLPSGPAGSSFSTAPGGVAAYSELLSRGRHPVSALRAPLEQARPAAGSTLVVVDAPELAPGAAARLRAFVSAGGMLVLAGGSALNAAARELIAGAPRWTATGAGAAHATAAMTRSTGVRMVVTAGPGTWLAPAGGLVLRPSGGALLIARGYGRGRVELLADASPLENRLLARADNAQLGLALAGGPGRPVAFAEAIHGYGPATGLAALPGRWWVTIGGLALAGGLWALARGRRLGPAEPAAPPPAPARSEYVDALATLLVRSRDRDGLAELARDGLAEPDRDGLREPADDAPAERAPTAPSGDREPA